MKHQQVVVDYWTMVKSSLTCLLLAFSGYILIKMIQTIFWLPDYLKNNQKRLEELAAQYSLDLNKEPKFLKEAEELTQNNDKENAEAIGDTAAAEAKKDI